MLNVELHERSSCQTEFRIEFAACTRSRRILRVAGTELRIPLSGQVSETFTECPRDVPLSVQGAARTALCVTSVYRVTLSFI